MQAMSRNVFFDGNAFLHSTGSENMKLALLRSYEIRHNWDPDAISKPNVGHDFGKLKLNKLN